MCISGHDHLQTDVAATEVDIGKLPHVALNFSFTELQSYNLGLWLGFVGFLLSSICFTGGRARCSFFFYHFVERFVEHSQCALLLLLWS